MRYKLLKKDGYARRGFLELQHGNIQTPVFMPVGTNATVKGLTVEDLEETGSQIILSNTYHLMLRPGDEIIKELGGLHNFCNWQKPILTDSGGFQVWSLGDLAKVSEKGVSFKSPYDGKNIFMSPEDSIQIQENLGSDIVMVFDECTNYPSPKKEAQKSMELSARWAARSKDAHKSQSALFGIVQGGMYEDLREESLNKLIEIDFDGIALGVEMFDCVLPTRNARNGQLITSTGVINIRNAKYKNDDSPIDENSDSKVCKNYSKAYLHHLDKTNEMLGSMLASYHNIYYYHELMKQIRQSIDDDIFVNFAKDFYNSRNLPIPDYLEGL